ncbi:hypothetical protein JXJ21_16580, partial [candidate division KSB1 bacterium]|nr:hypothetical protein [candidate division KSB1 bacterium]
FVNISQKIAVSYLKYQEITGKNISFDKRGAPNDLEDMAVDCIASLFMRDDAGQFTQLQRYFSSLVNSPIDLSNDEILVKLRGLVIKKTKQELSRIFRERDPEGAKIIRNIRVALKTSSDLCSFKEMGREFIFSRETARSASTNPKSILNRINCLDSNCAELNSSDNIEHQYPNLRRLQPAMPERTLKHKFLIHFEPRDPVSTIIRKMLMVIAEDPLYQNFLALDVASNLIRIINQELVHERLISGTDSESPMDFVRHKEIELAMNETAQFIATKLKQQYVQKNKLDSQKATIYLNSITDMINDLAGGKETESNFSYLKRHIPNLTQQQYRQDERSIFEYLVKLTKNDLIKNLKALL